MSSSTTGPGAAAADTPADTAAVVVDGDDQPGGPAGPVRVVIAEDEALIRMDLAEMLGELGYEVVAAVGDGERAVSATREHRPGLVVMDIKMPRCDGITAAEQLAADDIAPVVLLTAFSDQHLTERARDAGVMAYVLKPFTADDLRPALALAAARWRERQQLSHEVADLAERLATRKRLDRAKGVLMAGLDLDEAAAFRWLQKVAMDRRLSIREVADAVIAGAPDR